MKKTSLLVVIMLCAALLAGCGAKAPASSGDNGNVKTESTDKNTDKGKDTSVKGSLKQNADGLYEIKSAEDFLIFRKMVEEDMAKVFPAKSIIGGILMADIDLSDCYSEEEPFYPIGYSAKEDGSADLTGVFGGILDGNGHTISGIKCVQPTSSGIGGLFYMTTYRDYVDDKFLPCEIKNLIIKNSRFEGSAYVGAVTGKVERDTVFSNIVIGEDVVIKSTKEQGMACGVAVDMYGATYENCANHATVQGGYYAFAIANAAKEASGCSNNGTIMAVIEESDAWGDLFPAKVTNVTDCSNNGTVKGGVSIDE